MILTTTSEIQNREITEYLGLVAGEAIIGANVFKDFLASIRDVIGGRSSSYERVLKDLKQEAMQELNERALVLGADAVVGVSFDYESLGQNGSMLMVVITGTAVRLR